MPKMRTEAFKMRLAEAVRSNSDAGNIVMGMVADDLSRLPVILKDEKNKAGLIKELENIHRERDGLYRRAVKVSNAIKRLSVGQVMMPRPGGFEE